MPESHGPGPNYCPTNFNALRSQIRAVGRFQADATRFDPLLERIVDARPKDFGGLAPAGGAQTPDDARSAQAVQGDAETSSRFNEPTATEGDLRRLMDDAPSVALLDNGCGRGRVPVVAGQIIVSSTPLERQEIDNVLGDFGFKPASDLENAFGGDRESVLTLYRSTGQSHDLEGALDAARDIGVDAWPNAMMAMNVVTKSKSGAEPACCHPAIQESGVANDDDGQPLVVIIDTGVFRDGHAADWLKGVAGDVDPRTGSDRYLNLSAGHGTFVAGVVRQVGLNTRVYMLRAIDSDGFATDAVVGLAITAAVERIKHHGGRGVINLSLGDETYKDSEPPAIAKALRDLPDGIVAVAAAGNRNSSDPVYPAKLAESLPQVVAVASIDHNGVPSSWSKRADGVRFSAIGEGVVSTYLEGEERPGTNSLDDPYDPEPDTWVGPRPWAVWTGTSFAAPQISARLAQVLADEPGMSTAEAIAELERQILDGGGKRLTNFGVALTNPGTLMVASEPKRPAGDPGPTP